MENVDGVFVDVCHADQAKVFYSSKRFVEDIAENGDDIAVLLPDAKLANLVEDVIVLAPNATQSYRLSAVTVCVPDVAEVLPVGEGDSGTGVELRSCVHVASRISGKLVLVNCWYTNGCLANCLDGGVVTGGCGGKAFVKRFDGCSVNVREHCKR